MLADVSKDEMNLTSHKHRKGEKQRFEVNHSESLGSLPGFGYLPCFDQRLDMRRALYLDTSSDHSGNTCPSGRGLTQVRYAEISRYRHSRSQLRKLRVVKTVRS